MGMRAAVLVLTAVLGVLPAGAAAADEPEPGGETVSSGTLAPSGQAAVSVRVDDGTTETGAKREHTYTIRLRNIGAVPLSALTLTEALPSGMSAIRTDGAAAGADGRLAWTVDLPTGGEVVRTVKARVDRIPDGRGLASTACVVLPGESAPLVCSTDIDELPGDADLAASASLFGTMTLVGGITALTAAIGGAVWFVVRRRRTARVAPAD